MNIGTPTVPLQPYTPILPAGGLKRPEAADALGQGDFLRLLTTQLEQQDPFEPVDNTDMLAQLAQFSALAGTTTTNDTLQQILGKLDALIAVETANQTAASDPEPSILTNQE